MIIIYFVLLYFVGFRVFRIRKKGGEEGFGLIEWGYVVKVDFREEGDCFSF